MRVSNAKYFTATFIMILNKSCYIRLTIVKKTLRDAFTILHISYILFTSVSFINPLLRN